MPNDMLCSNCKRRRNKYGILNVGIARILRNAFERVLKIEVSRADTTNPKTAGSEVLNLLVNGPRCLVFRKRPTATTYFANPI